MRFRSASNIIRNKGSADSSGRVLVKVEITSRPQVLFSGAKPDKDAMAEVRTSSND